MSKKSSTKQGAKSSDLATSPPAASLAEELRMRGDQALSQLFQLRSDLTSPVAPDFSALATRATSTPSLIRALEALNKFQIQVLEAISVLEDPLDPKNLYAALNNSKEIKRTQKASDEAIEELWNRALIYFDGGKIRIPRAVREILGSELAGLGPVSLARIDFKELASAPKGAREVLDRLTWGPPVGAIGDRKKSGSYINWLLEKNFLLQIDQERVALAREAGLYLRGGLVHKNLEMVPPELEGKKINSLESDRASLASISNLLRWVAELMDFWAEETPRSLKSGGVGAKDLKKAADHLGVSPYCAAFVAELAFAAGLISIEGDDRVLPSTEFDLWQAKSATTQWRELISLWQRSTRVIGLINRSDSKGITPLGNELDRSWAPRIKSQLILTLERNPELAPELESAQKWIHWLAPKAIRSQLINEFVEWSLIELEWLGLTGAGRLSKYGEEFLTKPELIDLESALGEKIDYILIQGDNTAIAPGQLTIELARTLSTFADIESRGSATVYRFTEGSIRRGLDHGHNGDEIKAILNKISKTPLPQPLEYLIGDVSKRHGRLRVGYANTYIRSDDTSLISQILNDKKLESLRLRQIAPQVLISEIESNDSLEELRIAGYLPSLESSSGSVISLPSQIRAKSKPKAPKPLTELTALGDELIATAIRSLRASDRASRAKAVAKDLPRTNATETMALLRNFVELEESILIGYADTNGVVTQRVVEPISISMGNLIAKDHGNQSVTQFKIARITGVAQIADK
jgi:hypothetical protein